MTETIHTARLTLRPLRPEDAATLTALVGDLDVAQWLTLVPHPYKLADAEAFITAHQDTARFWAITLQDHLVGVISIGSELGYWLGKPHWGQGLMTEAATAVVAHHFERSREALPSGYHLGNAASCNVLTKLGFRPSERRVAHSRATGQMVTIQGMELSRAEWEARE